MKIDILIIQISDNFFSAYRSLSLNCTKVSTLNVFQDWCFPICYLKNHVLHCQLNYGKQFGYCFRFVLFDIFKERYHLKLPSYCRIVIFHFWILHLTGTHTKKHFLLIHSVIFNFFFVNQKINTVQHIKIMPEYDLLYF